MSKPSVEDPVPTPAQHKSFSVSSNGKIPTDQPKCSKAPPVFDFKTSRLMKEVTMNKFVLTNLILEFLSCNINITLRAFQDIDSPYTTKDCFKIKHYVMYQ